MSFDVRDDRALALVDDRAELELLANGFAFTEGLVWVAEPDGYLLFSDVPASRRWRWDERGGCRKVASSTGLGNGMTLDLDGRLLVCEGERGRVTRMDAAGDGSGAETVVGSHRGSRLNSPNDVVVRSDGSIYFTDSWWPNKLGRSLERELDFQGVFRFSAAGLELLLDDLDFPNGLCFSPDERLLYVNDSTPGLILVFDVNPDGSLSNRRIFAQEIRDEPEHVDGMKCDSAGNVWVTGPGGVWALDPEGTLLAVIRTPERAGNLCWGGPERNWLFIGASSSLHRIVTRVAG